MIIRKIKIGMVAILIIALILPFSNIIPDVEAQYQPPPPSPPPPPPDEVIPSDEEVIPPDEEVIPPDEVSIVDSSIIEIYRSPTAVVKSDIDDRAYGTFANDRSSIHLPDDNCLEATSDHRVSEGSSCPYHRTNDRWHYAEFVLDGLGQDYPPKGNYDYRHRYSGSGVHNVQGQTWIYDEIMSSIISKKYGRCLARGDNGLYLEECNGESNQLFWLDYDQFYTGSANTLSNINSKIRVKPYSNSTSLSISLTGALFDTPSPFGGIIDVPDTPSPFESTSLKLTEIGAYKVDARDHDALVIQWIEPKNNESLPIERYYVWQNQWGDDEWILLDIVPATDNKRYQIIARDLVHHSLYNFQIWVENQYRIETNEDNIIIASTIPYDFHISPEQFEIKMAGFCTNGETYVYANGQVHGRMIRFHCKENPDNPIYEPDFESRTITTYHHNGGGPRSYYDKHNVSEVYNKYNMRDARWCDAFMSVDECMWLIVGIEVVSMLPIPIGAIGARAGSQIAKLGIKAGIKAGMKKLAFKLSPRFIRSGALKVGSRAAKSVRPVGYNMLPTRLKTGSSTILKSKLPRRHSLPSILGDSAKARFTIPEEVTYAKLADIAPTKSSFSYIDDTAGIASKKWAAKDISTMNRVYNAPYDPDYTEWMSFLKWYHN